MLFTVSFYHFLFSRCLGLTKRHFSSDILVPFPDSSDLYSCVLLLQENLNWFWPWIIVRPFLPLQLWSYGIFFQSKSLHEHSSTKWCKTFDACTWIISKFDKNLPICCNIAIRRYGNPENFSSLSCSYGLGEITLQKVSKVRMKTLKMEV